ncbi:MAG: PilZ domain-containing protein [Sphingomonas sp.]|nr:PilZ domain-containing protein [Sphingomonas sp.]
MRVGAGWDDARILNISLRGLMIQAESPPPKRGSYVELRRGPRIIIGRVVWANQHRFGLWTQDPLDVESIIALPAGDTKEGASSSATVAVERRSVVRRNSAAFERSRQWSRAFEFVCITVFAVTGCLVAFGAVAQLFVVPLAAVEQGFKARQS